MALEIVAQTSATDNRRSTGLRETASGNLLGIQPASHGAVTPVLVRLPSGKPVHRRTVVIRISGAVTDVMHEGITKSIEDFRGAA